MLLITLYETLFEAVSISPPELYHKIKTRIQTSDVGEERDGTASNKWIAGIARSRTAVDHKTAGLLMALHAGRLDPETKEYRDAMRTKIAFDVLASYGLVTKVEGGRYAFPNSGPTGSQRREDFAAFRKYVSDGFNQEKIDGDMSKTIRNVGSQSAAEWEASLSEEDKKMLGIYKGLERSAFTFLKGLIQVRGDRREYNKRVEAARYNDSNDYVILQRLGIFKPNGNLDIDLLRKYDAFVKAQSPAMLKQFKKDNAEFVNRQEADKALARNDFNKKAEEDQVHKPETDAIARSRLHGIKGERRAARTIDRNTSFKKYIDTGA